MLFDLKKAGWCDPALIILIVGILVCGVLLLQLLLNRDKKKTRKELLISLIGHMCWFLITGALVFYMCSQGRSSMGYWILFIFYGLPVLGMLFYLAGSAYKRTQCDVITM